MAGADPGADRAFRDALESVIAELGLLLKDDARAKMLEHYRLLVRWNRRMNLTRVREPRQIAVRHFGESLFLLRELGLGAGSVIDVGSGAGFPGLPIAAWLTGAQVTLLESIQRKAVFLREVSRSWGNVEVRNERLEKTSGAWDVSVMRAVAAAPAVADLARISARVGILMGEEGLGEVRRTPEFVWEVPNPLPWGERRVLLVGRRRVSE